MILGNDYLAGIKYQRAVMEAHRKGDCGGIFLTTFGPAHALVERMCKSKKFSEIVVHIAPFAKTYSVPKLRSLVLKESRWLNSLAVKYGQTILISPFCESPNSAAVMRPLFAEMRQAAPDCLLVHSIHGPGQEVDGTITEIHIEKSSALPRVPKNEYTVSFDGCGSTGTGDMPDLDIDSIVKRYSGTRHIRAWNFRFNLKYGHKDKTAIANRTITPSVQYIRGTRALLDPREGSLSWKNSDLLKPFADDHGEKEPTKDNKLMCILPGVDRASVDVFDSKGKKIDTMRRFKPDHSGDPKGPRYYSTRYAFQVANIAFKNTGSYMGQIAGRPLIDLRKRSGRFK
jgi:hypothetical protein